MKAARSLKGRALQWLSQREQSRVELRRKLMRYAVAEDKARVDAEHAAAGSTDADVDRCEPASSSVSGAPPAPGGRRTIAPRRYDNTRQDRHARDRSTSNMAASSNDTHADADADADAGVGARADPGRFPSDDGAASAAERVESVLDWLEANRYLSPERFAEARVHARAARFGNLRIRQELKQHDVLLSAELAQSLHDSEYQRACAIHRRRFAPSGDAASAAPGSSADVDDPASARYPARAAAAAERARQARFLIARGFSPEVVRRVLRDAGAAIFDDD